jgi:hypothetical protein
MSLQDDTVREEPKYCSYSSAIGLLGIQEHLNGTTVSGGSPLGPVVPARHTKVSGWDRPRLIGRLRSQAQFVGSYNRRRSMSGGEMGQFHCAGMHGITLCRRRARRPLNAAARTCRPADTGAATS